MKEIFLSKINQTKKENVWRKTVNKQCQFLYFSQIFWKSFYVTIKEEVKQVKDLTDMDDIFSIHWCEISFLILLKYYIQNLKNYFNGLTSTPPCGWEYFFTKLSVISGVPAGKSTLLKCFCVNRVCVCAEGTMKINGRMWKESGAPAAQKTLESVRTASVVRLTLMPLWSIQSYFCVVFRVRWQTDEEIQYDLLYWWNVLPLHST